MEVMLIGGTMPSASWSAAARINFAASMHLQHMRMGTQTRMANGHAYRTKVVNVA